jgi:hypothetical protein
MDRDVLTFGEMFLAIRQGDWRIAVAFGLECLIMAMPVILVGLALAYQ